VKRRSSSGPTIGAMLGFWSGAVAMVAKDTVQTVSDAAKILLALVALMWAVEVVDVIADHQLDQYGIEAREPQGLDGIVTAPFLHVGFGHLISNTIPFVIMGLLIAVEGARRLVAVFAIVAVVSGLGTWIVAPEGSIHVGASGVVFGFATYLIARGWFNKRTSQIAIGLVILVIWGGVLVGGLQPREGISWQGHLFGAIGGLVAARVLARGDRGPTAPA
jgi:membrane associated rhomboid family serine protease